SSDDRRLMSARLALPVLPAVVNEGAASLMMLRNKAIAHSESSKNPVEFCTPVQKNAISLKTEPLEVLKEQIPLDLFLALCQTRKKQAMDTGFAEARSSAPKGDHPNVVNK
ncbi:hypothetical protein, partial [Candidatus Nitrotoga sp. HW29]|uniref:hypothetical protein n=1 Tax=Candidatus Nitrotoga sp. HW29 TaxID=2886963 RepID=UPI001EF1F537